jgi:hypothetical protein
VQHQNYRSRRLGGPDDPPEIGELYAFARERLFANYLFWTRRLYVGDRPYDRVVEFLTSTKFPSDPAGGLADRCPSAYASCKR